VTRRVPAESQRPLFDDVPPRLRALRREIAEAEERRAATAREQVDRASSTVNAADETPYWYDEPTLETGDDHRGFFHARRYSRTHTLAVFEPSALRDHLLARGRRDEGALDYRREYLDWIASRDIGWAWFVTGTFRDRRASFELGDRVWVDWVRDLEREALGARAARKRGLPWVRAIEEQRDRTAHFHGVVAGCGHLDLEHFEDDLSTRAGASLIEPYDAQRNGLGYLAKHVGRGAHLWHSKAVFARV
jgi:hypothetical protein